MAGGDDRAAEESVAVLGGVRYAHIKKSFERNKGSHLSIDLSRRLLRDTARRTMSNEGLRSL
jgi:D-aminopeptidase